MPQVTVTINASGDGYLSNEDPVYATCRDAINADDVYIGGNSLVGQLHHPMSFEYEIKRAALYFDTTAILVGSGIISAILKFWCNEFAVDNAFDVTVQQGSGGHPQQPLVAGDFDRTNYSGDGGSINTAAIGGTVAFQINLNSLGLGWIRPGGWTKFLIRSSRDINGNSPGAMQSEYIGYYGSHRPEANFKPRIEITYETGRELIAPPQFSWSYKSGSMP